MFFSRPDYLMNHFKFLTMGFDLATNVANSLESELRVLRAYLIRVGTPEIKESLTSDLPKDFTAEVAYNTLANLAAFWDEPLSTVIQFSTSTGKTEKRIDEPHLVVNFEDFNNVSLFCDRMELLKGMSLPMAIACLVALHFAAFWNFISAGNLKYYLTYDLCHFAIDGVGKEQNKKQSSKLRAYYSKKSEVLIDVYNDSNVKYMFGKRRA